MNKWLIPASMAGVVLLSACASDRAPKTLEGANAPHITAPRTVRAATKNDVNIVADAFRADAPDRYIVQPNDTLWSIAGRFLKNPAYWKAIWHANPQIKNPNKIYPGDIISYVTTNGQRKLQIANAGGDGMRGRRTGKTSDGRPIYKMIPGIRTEALDLPIPTVPKQVVYPFMTKNLVLEPGFSQDLPYVVNQADSGYISLTTRNQIYAKGDHFEYDIYNVYREQAPIKDPQSGALLGVEAVYIGQLKMVKPANEDGIATFVQTDSANPLYPKDVLIPAKAEPAGSDLSFFPKISSTDVVPVVIRTLGTNNDKTASQFSTVLINAGRDEDIQTGDVFSVVRAKPQMGKGRNGEVFQLPDYEVGIAIIYKVENNFSYAMIMNATDIIYPNDRFIKP